MLRTLANLVLRLGRLILQAMAIASLAVSVILLGTYFIVYAHFDGTGELPADCAVVFGAAVYGLNQPGPAIVRRVGAAAELYRDGSVKRLFLSGGLGNGNRKSEASVMRDQALRLGVSASDITLEEESHSTWENIANTKPLTEDCTSVIGISDQYHLARIELLSWRQGWGELQTFPAQDRPPVESEKRSLLREVLAFLYYIMFVDVIFPDFPARVL